MSLLRGVKASHILLSEEGHVYLSGLHSVYSMMREGKRMRAVFDMPHHSPALLPWLSPELLRQVSVLLLPLLVLQSGQILLIPTSLPSQFKPSFIRKVGQ